MTDPHQPILATLDAARRSGHTWADHIDCDPKDCTVAHLARAVPEPSGLDVERLARVLHASRSRRPNWERGSTMTQQEALAGPVTGSTTQTTGTSDTTRATSGPGIGQERPTPPPAARIEGIGDERPNSGALPQAVDAESSSYLSVSGRYTLYFDGNPRGEESDPTDWDNCEDQDGHREFATFIAREYAALSTERSDEPSEPQA